MGHVMQLNDFKFRYKHMFITAVPLLKNLSYI
jgi:hypothetical protein